MIRVNLFKIVVLIILAVKFGLAEGAEYALGAIETDLIGTAKPTHIDEIRRLRSSASIQATSRLLGEIVAIAQVQPSNALLGRVVKTNWTVFAYDVNTGLVVPNVDFILQPLRPAINSGGHDHDSPTRPLGALSAYGGNSGPTGMGLVIQYTSPDVSGTVYSDSSCTGPNGFSCFLGQFYSFTTQVPGLGILDPDMTYDLIGSTAQHFERGPIFRTGKLMILYQLARSFHETYSPSYFSRRI